MYKQIKRKPLAAALVAVLASPVFAADPTPADTTTLKDVEVRAGKPQGDYNPGVSNAGGKGGPVELRDVPQSITVINRSVMDAQGATTLKDALRNVPGITISAGEGGNIGDNINIRGFSARTDLFLDGFRDRSHTQRETFFIESVEVLKGPSSMLFGRGSTGGVINQVTKQADLNSRAEIGLGVGTDQYFRTTADVNQKLSDTSAFRVSALKHDSESTRDVIESERHGIAPSVRFGIGTPTEVAISALHQRSNETPDYGIPVATGTKDNPGKPVETDIDNFFGFTDDFYRQEVDVLTARISHKFSPALTLRNQTQYSSTRVHAAPTVYPNLNVAGNTTGRDRREREQDDRSVYNQTDLVSKFDTGAVKHTLVTGVELGHEEYNRQSYTWTGEPTQSISGPVYGPMPTGVTRARDATRGENEADALAVYINDTIELTEQWKLIAGVRWDQYAADVRNINNTTGREEVFARTDEMTSYRTGLLFQPDKRQSYYVSYGTSFNPASESLTLSATGTSGVNLDPEENQSLEIGAKWDLYDNKLALAAALFRVEKTNARTTDPLTSVTTLDGTTRVDGIELSASGQISPQWQIFTAYTFLDSELVEAKEVGTQGNRLQNTPEHSASLWAVYGFAPAWEVGGGVVYSSEKYLNNANTAEVDGYTRLDGTLAYKQKSYDVRFNLLNVTDEEYFEVASAGRATPAKGRAGVVTFNVKL